MRVLVLLTLASIPPQYFAFLTTGNPNAARQSSSSTKLRSSIIGEPIDGADWPHGFPAKDHCSRCGLCETSFVSKVTSACAFLGKGMSRMDQQEALCHDGRARDLNSMVWKTNVENDPHVSGMAEEARFGVLERPVQLAKGNGIPNAQWTGCVTGIALSMLESGQVDAVVCIANHPSNDDDWSRGEPILARTAQDVLRGRGVKPSLAPSLKVLDEIKRDPSIKKLLFCGVGCAVQAFRAVQDELDLDQVYVLGTNCADNSPTPQAAKDFIQNGIKIQESDDENNQGNIRGYEFMQDFRVHVKTDKEYVKKPYFTLPGTIAEASIAKSCLACFDYTNGLADVVVGYMGAPLDNQERMDQALQTLTVRNQRGSHMVDTALKANRIELHGPAKGTGFHEKLASATVERDSIVLKLIGDAESIPESGMPQWLGEVMATVMTWTGPKGVNFARYSIDYHILRNYLYVLHTWGPRRTRQHVPQYAMDIVNQYKTTDAKFATLCDLVMEEREKRKRSKKQ